MNEIWKDIENYEGLYQVSNNGNVKSVTRNKVIAKIRNHNGYLVSHLYKNGKGKVLRNHRLVANAFIENAGNKEYVNHIDGNKMNNCEFNLEWVSHEENMQHAYRTGLKIGSSEHTKVKVICNETGEIYNSITECAMSLGLHIATISRVVLGQQKTTGGMTFRRFDSNDSINRKEYSNE